MDETIINSTGYNYNRVAATGHTFNPSSAASSSYLGSAFPNAYQRLSLSNPASAHGSPDRSLMNSSMFSPPLTRRPPIAPRGGPLSVYNNGGVGYETLAGSQQRSSAFCGPSSLPSSAYYGGAGSSSSSHHRTVDDILNAASGSSRRANLNRMRQHRSLEGDVPYFSADSHSTNVGASGSYFDTIPPADPQVQQQQQNAAAAALAYGQQQRYQQQQQLSPRFSSQGNLVGGGGYGGSIYQTAGASTSYGNQYPGSSLNYPTSGSGVGGIGQFQSTGGYGHGQGAFSGHGQSGFGQGQSGGFGQNLGAGASTGPYANTLLTSSGLMNQGAMGGLGGLPMDGSSSFMASQPLTVATNPTVYYSSSFSNRDPYTMSMPVLQREFDLLRREYDSSMQKLNASMNSIKTFWSPELKKERAMRKEEASKLALMQEQLKMASQENQKQAAHMRQLQDELQCQYELSRTIRDTEIQSVPREEYEAVRLERDRLHRELHLAKDTLRELEVQIETQRQTLAARDDSVKKLLDMLQSKGLIPYSGAQDRLELEQNRTRIIDLENRCKHMENLVLQKDQDVHTLRDECLNASQKLRQLQMQFDRYQRIPIDEREATALQALLDTKVARIEQLEQRIALYEDEITKLREQRLSAPRNFTDKSVTDMEYQELKLKTEKLQLELNQRQTEYYTMQSRMSSSEEHATDLKKRLELMKESCSSKDNQIMQLQSDVEALRMKLETRTETIEHKTQQIQAVQQERNRLQSEIVDVNEQLKIRESKIASLQRKMESYEEMMKEKEHQLEMIKQRLAASPSMIQQKQFQEQLDELMRERDRLLQQLRDQRDRVEAERIEELDAHRREVRDLRLAIESLQKEITDRQMLIESQNEKISDLNRDLAMSKMDSKRLLDRGLGTDNFHFREIDRLSKELLDARGEVDRLLKIIQTLEKEKENLSAQIKDLEKQSEDAKMKLAGVQQMSTLERKKVFDAVEESKKRGVDIHSILTQKEQRVEELEEALKESVSITAERELAIAQQKQMSQQLESKMNQYKDQINKVQRQYEEMNTKLSVLQQDKQDKDTLIRSLKHERKKHLEEVMQLKEEALLAAISEKDAHIALLETSSSKNPDEIETLRKHKDKLIKKLKEENVRRVKLFTENDTAGDFAALLASSKDLKSSPADQIIQIIRYVELQRKKLRVFVDQLMSCMLDVDPHLLSGIPRPKLSECIDFKLLKKVSQEQLLIELKQRENDSIQLQIYVTALLQRFSLIEPVLVERALMLLDSFNDFSAYYGFANNSYSKRHSNYSSTNVVASSQDRSSTFAKTVNIKQQGSKIGSTLATTTVAHPQKIYATPTTSLMHRRAKPHLHTVPKRALSAPSVGKHVVAEDRSA